MKQLTFLIAEKIATDKRPSTVITCCSILKEAFKSEGISDKVANSMAIDGIKIIMRSMLKMVSNGK